MRVEELVARLGGFATRDDLVGHGCWPMMIDLSLYYGKIIRVRRGQYALPGVHPSILRALRIGGTLAWVSALRYYGDVADAGPVLAEAGFHYEDVVQSKLYVTNIADWEQAGKALGEVFGDIRPALSLLHVLPFLDAAMLVEVELVAVRRSAS